MSKFDDAVEQFNEGVRTVVEAVEAMKAEAEEHARQLAIETLKSGALQIGNLALGETDKDKT